MKAKTAERAKHVNFLCIWLVPDKPKHAQKSLAIPAELCRVSVLKDIGNNFFYSCYQLNISMEYLISYLYLTVTFSFLDISKNF